MSYIEVNTHVDSSIVREGGKSVIPTTQDLNWEYYSPMGSLIFDIKSQQGYISNGKKWLSFGPSESQIKDICRNIISTNDNEIYNKMCDKIYWKVLASIKDDISCLFGITGPTGMAGNDSLSTHIIQIISETGPTGMNGNDGKDGNNGLNGNDAINVECQQSHLRTIGIVSMTGTKVGMLNTNIYPEYILPGFTYSDDTNLLSIQFEDSQISITNNTSITQLIYIDINATIYSTFDEKLPPNQSSFTINISSDNIAIHPQPNPNSSSCASNNNEYRMIGSSAIGILPSGVRGNITIKRVETISSTVFISGQVFIRNM